MPSDINGARNGGHCSHARNGARNGGHYTVRMHAMVGTTLPDNDIIPRPTRVVRGKVSHIGLYSAVQV